MNISDRYQRIQEMIGEAAKRSGRAADAVCLLAVTKYQPWSTLLPLYNTGQRAFGESRLPEALLKKAEAPEDCQWHWIGTLQKNKVRKVVGEFALIHSVDSLELARKISLVSVDLGVVSRILLQANMSGEVTKHGFEEAAWKSSLEELMSLPNLAIEGMMTMAAIDADEHSARACFSRLRRLRDSLRHDSGNKLLLAQLSMGMSRDFVWAIEEGATIVRLGSAFWGTEEIMP